MMVFFFWEIGAYKAKVLHCHFVLCLQSLFGCLLAILIPKRYNMESTNKLRSFGHIRLSLWQKIKNISLTISGLSQWKEGHEQSSLSSSCLTSSERVGPTMGTSHSRSPTRCQNSRCLLNLSSLLTLLQSLAHS